MKINEKQLQTIAWLISLLAVVVSVIAWGGLYKWKLGSLGAYQFFPLLGLLAFGLMWSHYIAAALKRYSRAAETSLKTYFDTTSAAVLVAILLHPGILIWNLWQSGLGLPPGSIKFYTGEALYGAAILGVIAFTAFLAYELRRYLSGRSWWKYIQYASDLAMFLVFIHALRLGSHLQRGWFKGVWYFYGATLVLSLVYMYSRKSNDPS